MQRVVAAHGAFVFPVAANLPRQCILNRRPCGGVKMNSNMETLDWPCPSSATLAREAAQLPKDVAAVLYSVAELADAAAAERFEVLLDEREHPAQSLLQHEFSEYQGPALCFIIPGEAPQRWLFNCLLCSPMRDATRARVSQLMNGAHVGAGLVMSAEEVSRLQLALVPFLFRNRECSYGSGLTLSYLVTDVLQILSGQRSTWMIVTAQGPSSARGPTLFKIALRPTAPPSAVCHADCASRLVSGVTPAVGCRGQPVCVRPWLLHSAGGGPGGSSQAVQGRRHRPGRPVPRPVLLLGLCGAHRLL